MTRKKKIQIKESDKRVGKVCLLACFRAPKAPAIRARLVYKLRAGQNILRVRFCSFSECEKRDFPECGGGLECLRKGESASSGGTEKNAT